MYKTLILNDSRNSPHAWEQAGAGSSKILKLIFLQKINFKILLLPEGFF
jgi:hypothetical protein